MQIFASEVGYNSRVDQLANQNTSPSYKWFVLYDNKLDGSYRPIPANGSLEVGWWGTTLSNALGVISSNPTIQFVYDTPTPIHSLGLMGDALKNDYPVDFTYELYSGSTLIHTENITNNASAVWKKALTQTYVVTSLKLIIKKVNKANRPARLMEVTTPNELIRSDTLSGTVVAIATSKRSMSTTDTLAATLSEQLSLSKTLYSNDTLQLTDSASKSIQVNLTKNDSTTISTTEQSLLKEKRLYSSDDLTITEVTSKFVQVSLANVDTLTISSDDTRAVTNQLKSTDDCKISATDQSFFVQYQIASSDTTTVSSTESKSITVSVTSSDSLLVSAAETSSVPEKRLTSTDSLTVSSSEERTTGVLSIAADTLSGITDTSASVEVSLASTDNFSINASDSSFFVQLHKVTGESVSLSETSTTTVQAQLTGSDNNTLTATEQSLLKEKRLYSTDSLVIGGVPGVGLTVHLNSSVAYVLSALEASDITANLAATDTGKVSSTEASWLVQYHFYSGDSLTLSTAESSKITVQTSSADTLEVTETATSNITASVLRADSVTLTMEHTTSINVELSASETQEINLTENSSLRQYHFYSTDSLVVNASEARSLQVDLSSADALGILGVDTSSITASVKRSDITITTATDSSKVTVQIQRTDTSSINLAETAFVPTTTLVRSDSWSLSLSEQRGANARVDRQSTITAIIQESKKITVKVDSTDIIALQALLEAGLHFSIRSKDYLTLEAGEDKRMTNIHTQMSADGRQVFAKVEVTYTDPFSDETVEYTASETGRYTDVSQLADNVSEAQYKWFSLHDNKLDGSYHPLPAKQEYSVGWWGTTLSDESGYLNNQPTIIVTFEVRALTNLRLVGDNKLDVFATDFTMQAYNELDQVVFTRAVVGNTEMDWYELLQPAVLDVCKIRVTLHRINKPNCVAKLTEMFTAIKETYYADDIESIRLFEETGYNTGSLPIGNISANEIDITLSNKRRQFDVNNKQSILHGYVKRNRRVQAWLGAMIGDEIEWHRLGVFWTTAWDIGRKSLVARLTARDRLELLRLTDFETSTVYYNHNLHELFEMILLDAGLFASDFVLDPSLENVIIPIAWFDKMSHRAALQRLARCSIIQVYCTKEGRIRVNLDLDATDYVVSSFDEDVNTFNVKYPIAVSEQVNHIQITAKQWTRGAKEKLYESSDVIALGPNETITKTLEFRKSPVVEITTPQFQQTGGVVIDSQELYCWGMKISFKNTNTSATQVSDILIEGYALEDTGKQLALAKDDRLIREDGKISVSHEHDFIQEITYAQQLADKILDTFKESRSDVAIDNRGDVALQLGDRVYVIDPDEDNLAVPYVIQRQQLTWAGFLSANTECKKL